jgi:hypothetical protein
MRFAGSINIRPIVKRRPILAAVMFAGAALAPALAGQPAVDLDLAPGWPLQAEPGSGKAVIVPPAARAPEQDDTGRCVSALPCGTRLFGTVRKNGAVELQVPALRW